MVNKKYSQKTLDFIERLKNKYSYYDEIDTSEIEYFNNRTKIIVIFKKYRTKHLLIPDKMLSRNSKCCLENSINKRKFTECQFFEKHGNIHDYSLNDDDEFNDPNNIIKIICLYKHIFSQKIKIHKKGHSCQVCDNMRKSNGQKTTDDFLKTLKYNDVNDYSEFEYIKSNSKSIVKHKKYRTKHLIAPDKLSSRNQVCNIKNTIDQTYYAKCVLNEINEKIKDLLTIMINLFIMVQK